jgi:hypothetical protein
MITKINVNKIEKQLLRTMKPVDKHRGSLRKNSIQLPPM